MNAPRFSLALTVILFTLPTTVALGQTNDGALPFALKKRLAEAGRLMDADNAAKACPILEEIVVAAPQHLASRASLADCYARIGKFYSASRLYTIVEKQAADENQNTTRRMAIDRRAAIEQKISHVRVIVPDALAQSKDLIVLQDGERVFPAQWGVAAPVDRGTHTIEAQLPGETTWKKVIDVWQDGAIVVVNVDMPLPYRSEKPMSEKKGPSSAKMPGPVPVTSTTIPGKTWSTGQILGMTTAGVGALGLGIGIAFGGAAISKLNESNDGHCKEEEAAEDYCTPTGLALRNETLTYGNVSTAMFIAGGILAAGGLTLWAISPDKRKIAPKVGIGPGNIVVQGQF
jgi:hypothetical protein